MSNKTLTRLALFGAILTTACSRDVDPAVATHYLDTGSREELRSQVFSKLLQFYNESDKSKTYYEVIARKHGRFIVNYYPAGKLLTTCEDPGSGWSDQVKNVDEAELKRLVDLKLPLDSLRHFVFKDSVLKDNDPFIQVKTNGSPSLL